MERKFKYLWRAIFKNKVINQHPQDLYSKYDPNAEWNPSSFRDFMEYFEGHKDELKGFELSSDDKSYVVDFTKAGHPEILSVEDGKVEVLQAEPRYLTDVEVLYYRSMESSPKDSEPKVVSYALGYEGVDEDGNVHQIAFSVV